MKKAGNFKISFQSKNSSFEGNKKLK